MLGAQICSKILFTKQVSLQNFNKFGMTSRELEILYTIYQLGGQCSMRKISQETGLSPDYTFLISKVLLNRKLIKKTAHNVFILTMSGKSLFKHLRDGSEGRKKTPTLIKVSHSFSGGVEPPTFKPEIHFINKEFMSEEPRIIEHNLSKCPITEVVDAKLIQKSIKRLTFVNRKGLNSPYVYE